MGLESRILRRARRLRASALGFAAVAGLAAPCWAEPPAWTDLGAGMEHAALGGEAVRGHAFRFTIARVRLALVPAPDGRATVDALAPPGDSITINASFFDTEGRAMGLAVDHGRSLAGRRLAKWGALLVEDGRARVLRGADLPEEPRADLVVQGLPRLVADGRVLELKAQRSFRTAVCADGTRLTLVVTTARVDTTVFARFLAAAPEAGGLGCRSALNLDGGASTQLRARWGEFRADVPGGWGVPNALVVTPKEAEGL